MLTTTRARASTWSRTPFQNAVFKLSLSGLRLGRSGRRRAGGDDQAGMGEPPLGGSWASCGHGDLHTTRTDAHERADLQELEADRAAGRGGKPSVGQPDPAQRADENVSHGGKPQPQLVGPH